LYFSSSVLSTGQDQNLFRLAVFDPEIVVANGADDSHVMESAKRLGSVALSHEHFLASLTPGLEVVGIIVILNEPDSAVTLYHVTTDNRSHTPAMRPAIYIQWLIVCHDRLSKKHIRCHRSSTKVP